MTNPTTTAPPASLDLLQQVLAVLPLAVWITDEKGCVLYGNPASQRMCGMTGHASTKPEDHPLSRKHLEAVGSSAVRAIQLGDAFIDKEVQIETLDGDRKTVLSSALPILAKDGSIAGAVVVNHDITERKRFEERLREISEHDALTGACNRRRLYEVLEEEIDRARRYGSPLSLLMLDLDHFKKINDEHGHQAGDLVLAGLAKCMRKELRSIDILARYGGEEFVVATPGIAREQAGALAERLRMRIAGTQFDSLPKITCSFGVCELQGGDIDVDSLIRRADELMYRAKRAGRNRVVVESASA